MTSHKILGSYVPLKSPVFVFVGCEVGLTETVLFSLQFSCFSLSRDACCLHHICVRYVFESYMCHTRVSQRLRDIVYVESKVPFSDSSYSGIPPSKACGCPKFCSDSSTP